MSWWRWKARCRGSAGTGGGAQRVPPHQGGYGGPACRPVPGAQPRPHPCSWIPLERGHFHGLLVSPPPPRALSPSWEVGGEGREGRQIPALFPREWEKPKWQRAASERAGLRRLGCLIKKWPRWPPPGTAGAFLRLPPPAAPRCLAQHRAQHPGLLIFWGEKLLNPGAAPPASGSPQTSMRK